MGSHKKDIHGLYKMIDVMVKPVYRRSMKYEAIKNYVGYYRFSKNPENPEIDPREKTIEKILFEINSRKSKL